MKISTIAEVNLEKIVADNDKWWRGELGRPIFNAVLQDDAAGVSGQGYSPRRFLPQYPRDTPAATIIDAEYARLSGQRYLADGFPLCWMNFGPGVLAAMVGGEGRAAAETVWFEPGKFAGQELADMKISFDPQTDWARWLTELYEEAVGRAAKLPVVLGMTDLGGGLDVLASLRGSEQLLIDLFDAPEEVKRLAAEEGAAWIAAYEHFAAITGRAAPAAYSCWAGILSSRPCYMLQSDFSYMISPDMFAEFVRPELAKSSAYLAHSFYHLDGKGQLGHLPHLFSIPGLRGIQWIPGDGQPPQYQWPELLAAIEDAGFMLQLLGSIDNVEPALRLLKHPERAQVWMGVKPGETARCERFLGDFGA